MNTVQRSALVMHSDQTMFDLVNDVANYPQFMEGCQSAEVIEHTEHEMIARLELKKGRCEDQFYDKE